MAPRHKTPSKREKRLGYYIAGAKEKVKRSGRGSLKQQMQAKAARRSARELTSSERQTIGNTADRFISRLAKKRYISDKRLWLANLNAFTRFAVLNLGGKRFRSAIAKLKTLRNKKGVSGTALEDALNSRVSLLESLVRFAGEIESALKTNNLEKLKRTEEDIQRELREEKNLERKALLEALLIRIKRNLH